MNTLLKALNMLVAIGCGIYARFLSCEEARNYLGKMYFYPEQGGNLCTRVMLALSGKPGSAIDLASPDEVRFVNFASID